MTERLRQAEAKESHYSDEIASLRKAWQTETETAKIEVESSAALIAELRQSLKDASEGHKIELAETMEKLNQMQLEQERLHNDDKSLLADHGKQVDELIAQLGCQMAKSTEAQAEIQRLEGELRGERAESAALRLRLELQGPAALGEQVITILLKFIDGTLV